ncbi:MAG: Na+/H+ antiporter subunit E [Calothrix sp. FI2-JRJ7]|jgi:multicomponent Na+:H+ antiporter subunit E|nr:Na+/H+ antiporter subunit E [Calothrix sp. FI2-JRJ7]
MIGHFILRLLIWFLLTANFTVANTIIGVCIAVLLPRSNATRETLKDWLQMLWKIILAVPQAYMEAFELLVRPHKYEEVVMERVSSKRSPRMIFLDVFLITFTPKTIVFKYHEEGWYEVHQIRRRRSL